MYGALLKVCFGTVKAMLEVFVLASVFYVASGDRFAAFRPAGLDEAMVRYRLAVDDAIAGHIDLGGLDKKVVATLLEANPRDQFVKARDELRENVRMTFDRVLP